MGNANRFFALMSVCARLDREWEQISTAPSAAIRLAVLAVAEPQPAGCRNPRELLAAIAAPGRAVLAHEVLRCLLRQADDPLAARSFLQAVPPALRATKVWYPIEDFRPR